MNRTIKFRAWDVDEKEMLDDVCTNTDDFTDMLNETFSYWQNHDFEPRLILMQFTGLKDKNGKEIYEGDVMRITYGTAMDNAHDVVSSVSYEEDMGMFTHDGLALAIGAKHGEIIGNIYENPEILK